MSKTKQLTQGDLVRECKSIELRLTKNLVEFCLAKFDRGAILKQVIVDEKQYGKGIMETLADELGYSAQTLYLEHSFARYFAYDRKKLEREIESLQKKGLKDPRCPKPSFEYFRRQLNPASNPEVVGGEEYHAKNLTSNIERLAQDVSDAVEVRQRLDPEKAIEVEGATIAGVEVLQEGAEWLVGNIEHPKVAKKLKLDLPHYKRWLKENKVSPISGQKGDPHHVVYESRGESGLDIFCVILTRVEHDEYHAMGRVKFERKYSLDLRLIILANIQDYIREHK